MTTDDRVGKDVFSLRHRPYIFVEKEGTRLSYGFWDETGNEGLSGFPSEHRAVENFIDYIHTYLDGKSW